MKVIFFLPSFVGVPVMSPELFMLSPAGSFPLMVHVAEAEAESWKEYAVPTVAGGSSVVVIDGAVAASAGPDDEPEAG